MSDPQSNTAILAVRVDDATLALDLVDGRSISAPLAWFPRLAAASEEQRARFELCAGGTGLHWAELDEDISAAGLLRAG